ncbi:MAG: L,D-transpeptidase [Pyrinomonadaceae bacterium]
MSALFLVGCEMNTQQPVNRVASDSVNTAAPASPMPMESPVSTPVVETAGITLPVLDALLTDEEFLAAAKSELQLSDDEIGKLRESARTAVTGLSEENVGDETRSTRSAAEEALKQVQTALGSAKSSRFLAFVNERVAAGANSTGSNQVPTDTRVVVNAPAYRMDVFKDGNLVKTYKIGIGYPEFPLPSGLRSAKAIIFNPTWTPPDEPWVKGKIEAGKKVEAGDKLNPLGPIKIPIGSPSLIHGGKSAARLGNFASHGCVGLTNGQVEDFAVTISGLGSKPLTLLDVKGYGKNKTETKQIALEQPVPVELRYETIIVEDGTLKLFRDVYEKGTNTEANLRKVLDGYGVSLDSLRADLRQKLLDGLKQMSKDATGQTVNAGAANTAANSNKLPMSEKVTSNVKGKKELSFKIPQLAGKGYPVPKNLKAS